MSTIYVAKTGQVELRQALLSQAVAFFNAASRCGATISITPLVSNSPMAPMIVCYAFAAELYLKLLYTVTVGPAEKLHGLDTLFGALPGDVKLSLQARYGEGKIIKDLTAVSSAFVDWRYLHEADTASIDPRVLMRICRAAHEECRARAPELKVFGENATAHFGPAEHMRVQVE